MENLIRHDGTIESIEGSHIKVRILQTTDDPSAEGQEGCAACKVASRCHAAQTGMKVVEADGGDGHWQVGQRVTVEARASMAGRALLIGFGGSLLLMLAVLAAALATGCSEGLTALLMLGSLLPYYLAVWLWRDRLARQLAFRIGVRSEELVL